MIPQPNSSALLSFYKCFLCQAALPGRHFGFAPVVARLGLITLPGNAATQMACEGCHGELWVGRGGHCGVHAA